MVRRFDGNSAAISANGDRANDGVAEIQTATAKRFLAFPFLVIAGIASVFMSFLGLFVAGWEVLGLAPAWEIASCTPDGHP
jgi:hypothetical protein